MREREREEGGGGSPALFLPLSYPAARRSAAMARKAAGSGAEVEARVWTAASASCEGLESVERVRETGVAGGSFSPIFFFVFWQRSPKRFKMGRCAAAPAASCHPAPTRSLTHRLPPRVVTRAAAAPPPGQDGQCRRPQLGRQERQAGHAGRGARRGGRQGVHCGRDGGGAGVHGALRVGECGAFCNERERESAGGRREWGPRAVSRFRASGLVPALSPSLAPPQPTRLAVPWWTPPQHPRHRHAHTSSRKHINTRTHTKCRPPSRPRPCP